tara:strand:+ start:93 stop:452 length:360 start_codon:yes stop_codon:yes gene_type:complete
MKIPKLPPIPKENGNITELKISPYKSKVNTAREKEPGVWDSGHVGPPIHGLASGNRYPNDIQDPGTYASEEQVKQYWKEPEVQEYLKNNPQRLWKRFAGREEDIWTLNRGGSHPTWELE